MVLKQDPDAYHKALQSQDINNSLKKQKLEQTKIT